MKVFTTAVELRHYLEEQRTLGKKIGFVPTMGALHDGHISLVQQCLSTVEDMVCVASIFVNPTQFNDKKDYEKYPITIDQDLEMLLKAGCEVVFLPSVDEIYPNGLQTDIAVDLGFLGTTLEAAHRPGHFQGVVQVVKILLDKVQPDFLFLGQKDYQQCMVITRLVEAFNMPVEIVICPTKREVSGLAMSSRNRRLSDQETALATNLSKILFEIKKNYKREMPKEWVVYGIQFLKGFPEISLEYLSVVDGKTLQEIQDWQDTKNAVALIAAKIGTVRLIDNLTIY
ncbi:MAG: pantoate--beta-alanine ligase [Chitinophagales bacterium]|nr:pantoate--beta-alanine ligase [Chitinophagales bacterium]